MATALVLKTSRVQSRRRSIRLPSARGPAMGYFHFCGCLLHYLPLTCPAFNGQTAGPPKVPGTTGRRSMVVVRPKSTNSPSGARRLPDNELHYDSFHTRVYRLRGKADKCIFGCEPPKTKKRRFCWANMTGNYSDPQDYAPMCYSCHNSYDRARTKGWSEIEPRAKRAP